MPSSLHSGADQYRRKQLLIIALLVALVIVVLILIGTMVIRNPQSLGSNKSDNPDRRAMISSYKEVIADPSAYQFVDAEGYGSGGANGVTTGTGRAEYALVDVTGDCVPELLLAELGTEIRGVRIFGMNANAERELANVVTNFDVATAGGFRANLAASKTGKGLYQTTAQSIDPMQKTTLVNMQSPLMNQSSPHWTYPFENPPAEITQDTQEIQWLSTDNVQPIEQLADKTGCAEKNGDADQRGQNAAAPTPATVQPDDNGNKPNPTPATGRDGSANSRSKTNNSGSSRSGAVEDDPETSWDYENQLTGTVRVFQTDAEMTSELGMRRPNPTVESGPHTVLVLDSPTVIHGTHSDVSHHPDGVAGDATVIGIPDGTASDGEHVTLTFKKSQCSFPSDTRIPGIQCHS